MVDAAYEGDSSAVESALKSGVSADARSPIGMTALMAAARNNHVETMKLLLKSGANVNQKDSNGWTALMAAAHRGHLDAVKTLIEAGAIIDIRSNDGKTAVDLSADRNDAATLSYFYDVIGTKPNTTPGDVPTRVHELESPDR